MRLVGLSAVLIVCAVPASGAAQPWKDAYRAGDYRTAANLLHPILMDERQLQSDDPAPARHLAILYAEGRGVVRDQIVACSLAQMAYAATMMSAPKYAQQIGAYDAALKEADQFVQQHCSPLTDQQRLAAGRSMGCFGFGMPEEIVTVGSYAVQIGHDVLRLVDAPDRKAAVDQGCPQFIVRVRPVTFATPADVAPGVKPRHFLEIVSWQAGKNAGDRTVSYMLQWQMYEVRKGGIRVAAREIFDSSSSWQPTLPADFDARLTLEMIRSGHVRWRMEGAPPKRGWMMLPEDRTP